MAKGHYGVVHAGIDRLVGRDMLVGVGTQYDRVVRKGKSDKQVADVEGHGWMAGSLRYGQAEREPLF